jgi:uncharacterized NAD(P)/FAD-binding protein YdhS
LIRSLRDGGLARTDPHGLGHVVEANGQLLGTARPSPSLFAVGPLGQGTLWEIVAVSEIVRKADAAAEAITTLAEPALRTSVASS